MRYYFKLDYNIADPIEVDFAKRELQGLFPGELKSIRNFGDALVEPPLRTMIPLRIHDYLLRSLCYGETHGFESDIDTVDISELVRRLAYTREIYVVSSLDDSEPNHFLEQIYPNANIGVDTQIFHRSGLSTCAFRIIAHTYLLEGMSAVVKFSAAKTKERQLERVRENVDRLIQHTQKGVNYIPLHPGATLYKEVEDLFDERKEEKLYVSHRFGPPYKAKFHPRMVKSVMNYIGIKGGDPVLDPFVGSGTTAIECALIGIDSVNVDISPECVLATRAKIAALHVNLNDLDRGIKQVLSRALEPVTIPDWLREEYPKDPHVPTIYRLKQQISQIENPEIQDLLMSTLSKVTSKVMHERTKQEPIEAFEDEAFQVYKTAYAFHQLKMKLNLRLGNATVHRGDARTLPEIGDSSIAGIVTSPPYSTAVDYIRNDLPMLRIIHAVPLDELHRNMMGNPRLKNNEGLVSDILADTGEFATLPDDSKKAVSELVGSDRKLLALRQVKFLIDMKKALTQMFRVLKPSKTCVIIIGSNNFQTRKGPMEFKNAEYIYEIGSRIGFDKSEIIKRTLIKTSYGAIRHESLVVLKKP